MKKIFLVMALAVLSAACMRLPQVPTLGEFSLPVAGEKAEWTSTDYEGKPVLIVFMGSWCPYCKMSMPFIDAANENFGGQVEIVAAFLDDDAADVAKVVKEHNFKTKALYNAGNIAESMEVSGLPHVVVFDKKHNAVKMWEGFSPELGQEIHDYLKKVSKYPSPAALRRVFYRSRYGNFVCYFSAGLLGDVYLAGDCTGQCERPCLENR